MTSKTVVVIGTSFAGHAGALELKEHLGDEHEINIVAPSPELVFGVLATIIAMWFSRRREFRADAGSARMVGADRMAAALHRLHQAHEPADLPASMAAFGIRGGGSVTRLFASHPPIEARIRALAELQAATECPRHRR